MEDYCTWRALPGSLAIDPQNSATLYATMHHGVYKSTDGGVSWSPFNTGLANTNVHALAIDPLTPTTVYAGTDDCNVSTVIDDDYREMDRIGLPKGLFTTVTPAADNAAIFSAAVPFPPAMMALSKIIADRVETRPKGFRCRSRRDRIQHDAHRRP